MKLANEELRNTAKAARVRLWQVADALGISEATITRMLRKELSADTKAQILGIIERLGGGSDGNSKQ